jgi:hypothetical protein
VDKEKYNHQVNQLTDDHVQDTNHQLMYENHQLTQKLNKLIQELTTACANHNDTKEKHQQVTDLLDIANVRRGVDQMMNDKKIKGLEQQLGQLMKDLAAAKHKDSQLISDQERRQLGQHTENQIIVDSYVRREHQIKIALATANAQVDYERKAINDMKLALENSKTEVAILKERLTKHKREDSEEETRKKRRVVAYEEEEEEEEPEEEEEEEPEGEEEEEEEEPEEEEEEEPEGEEEEEPQGEEEEEPEEEEKQEPEEEELHEIERINPDYFLVPTSRVSGLPVDGIELLIEVCHVFFFFFFQLMFCLISSLIVLFACSSRRTRAGVNTAQRSSITSTRMQMPTSTRVGSSSS